jgi:hypothetical protein
MAKKSIFAKKRSASIKREDSVVTECSQYCDPKFEAWLRLNTGASKEDQRAKYREIVHEYFIDSDNGNILDKIYKFFKSLIMKEENA